MKLISIVVPAYNEQENLSLLYQKVQQVFTLLNNKYEYELIFVNDGSKDATWTVICSLAATDKRVKGINFSRNFGHQIALSAGYDFAQGAAVISLDADLQHPPEVITQMLEKWEQGFEVVYAKRINRDDPFLKKFFTRCFYFFLNQISDVSIPADVADFRLIDRKVLLIIKQSKEQFRFLRGMIAWTGFKSVDIPFVCQERHAGKTAYTMRKMFKLAFDGITGFSTFPLRLAAYVGLFVIVTGVAMFAYITCDFFVNNVPYPLFKWLVTIIYIFMGVQFVLLWLIGEYIGRIYNQGRERPLYVVSDTINT